MADDMDWENFIAMTILKLFWVMTLI